MIGVEMWPNRQDVAGDDSGARDPPAALEPWSPGGAGAEGVLSPLPVVTAECTLYCVAS